MSLCRQLSQNSTFTYRDPSKISQLREIQYVHNYKRPKNLFQNKKMLVNSIQSNEHITLKTGEKKTFGTERSSQSSRLLNHKPVTQPKKSESSWSSRGSLEVRKCQFHSNSSEIPTELNEFTEVYKRSFCKETFLESQIMQFSENGFIWK